MGKKVISYITCLALIFSGLQFNWKVEEVEAAQFAGTHFAMEFSGYDSANMEKAHGWSNGGMFNCTWLDSNVNFSNDGIMSLTINSNGSGGYTGGEYRSREYFGYGMYQVNMKPIKNPGVVTSFFTYTGPTDGTIWDEIDIEFLGYDTTKVQFNYFSNSVGNHEYIHDLGFDASQAFHTYGFYWGPGTITWYVDGVAVYTVNSSDVPVTPGKIMMNVWPGTGVDDWLKPYNGATPLTGYYDWAVYDAPGSGEQTTTQTPTTQRPSTGPSTPEGLVATLNEQNKYYTIAFADVANATSYNLYLDGNYYSSITNGGALSYETLTPGKTYSVQVTAVNGSGESAKSAAVSITIPAKAEVTTTTPAVQDGYVLAGPEWTNLDYWSVYFASGWANNPTGSYKAGNSYNDFSVKLNSASATDWGVQVKTQQLTVDPGSRYKATVKANANMSSVNQIRFKDDGSQTEKFYTITQGANIFELEFTAASFAQIFFDLGQAPAGLQLDITSFELTKVENATEVPTETTTTNTPGNTGGGYDSLAFQTIECAGTPGLTLEYAIIASTVAGLVPWYGDGGITLSLQFSADAGNVSDVTVNGAAASSGVVTEKALGLVKINPNMLADNAYSEIKVITESGEFTIVVKKGIPGVEMPTEEPTEAPTETPTEAPTEEPTTEVNRIEDGIEVNGYQVSATAKGMRTLYSVDSEINGKDVISSGLVYSLTDYVPEDELYVGSANEYVNYYESTDAGKADFILSDSDLATTYAMTMKFATSNSAEYTSGWRVCAYAKLSDGTYVYSKAYTYTIYDVANNLYQNGKMSTKNHHDYLYTDILSIVNKDYIKIEYDWSNSLA